MQLLTVMLQELNIVVAQWSVRGEKTNEPQVLLNHLEELRQRIPALSCFTGDAIYAQRPLAEAMEDANCDYVLQIKANQGDTLEALRCSLGEAHERKPDAQNGAEKRGVLPIDDVCGRISLTRPISASTLGAISPCHHPSLRIGRCNDRVPSLAILKCATRKM